MAAKTASLLVRTPIFRMSHANVVKPKPYEDPKTGKKGDPTFNVEALIDPETLGKFQVRRDDSWVEEELPRIMAEVAKTEWPQLNLKDAVANGDLGWPLVDGARKKAKREAKGKKGDVYDGVKVLPMKASEKYPPQLYVLDGGEYRELDREKPEDVKLAESLFKSGNYVKASINIKAGEFAEKFYVTAYVNALVFARKGEPIGGMSAEERFGGVEGGMADIDPTEGMTGGEVAGELDDEIPF